MPLRFRDPPPDHPLCTRDVSFVFRSDPTEDPDETEHEQPPSRTKPPGKEERAAVGSRRPVKRLLGSRWLGCGYGAGAAEYQARLALRRWLARDRSGGARERYRERESHLVAWVGERDASW